MQSKDLGNYPATKDEKETLGLKASGGIMITEGYAVAIQVKCSPYVNAVQ